MLNTNRMNGLCASLIGTALLVTSLAAPLAAQADPSLAAAELAAAGDRQRLLRVDVVQNATDFFFEGPTNENGVPAKGTPFVTTGYIYPGGTLEAFGHDAGIRANGEPAFPELVIGTWTCSGWHLLDGDAPTGVVVITRQTFDFDFGTGTAGDHMLVTDGIELADFNVAFDRPITGATGKFSRANGQMEQTYLDFNESGGFNSTFVISLR